jgi:hypothetical protein
VSTSGWRTLPYGRTRSGHDVAHASPELGRKATSEKAAGSFGVGSSFEYINKRGGRSTHTVLDVSLAWVKTDRGQRFKLKTLQSLSEQGTVIPR